MPIRERQPAYVNQWIEQHHGPDEFHGHQSDCINPKCDYHFPPQVIQELEQYGEAKCPNCGLLQNIMGTVGPYDENNYTPSGNSRGNRPGGGTISGLTLNEMGRIGEEVAKRAQLPGFTFKHQFTAPQWPVDQLWTDENGQDHGMEIKTCHSLAQPRFKLGDAAERQKKIEYCGENGLRQGLIGVRLNFHNNTADVFHRPQFTDTWVGAPTMTHAGTFDFSDLNPFKSPGDVPHDLPEEQDIPF